LQKFFSSKTYNPAAGFEKREDIIPDQCSLQSQLMKRTFRAALTPLPMNTPSSKNFFALLLFASIFLSSCYSFKLATKAQPAGDELSTTTIHAHSLFWGLVNKPQVLKTPPCDALGALGVAEVKVKTSFLNALVTVGSLGIYCPVKVIYKCSKTCPQTDSL
jgi:hypothetical protein